MAAHSTVANTTMAGTDRPASTSQYLTFALAGEQFAIPILAVQEIRGWEPISRTPRAPAYVLGVMNLRGAIVPILDLRSLQRRPAWAPCGRRGSLAWWPGNG